MRPARHTAALVACGLALVALGSGCGATAADDRSAPVSARSATPTPTPTTAPLELPSNFVRLMAHHGYVLDQGNAADASIDADTAVIRARTGYGLFSDTDPAVAAYYLVTTPRGGPLENPQDPGSPVEPDLDHAPMWVVYARTDVLKDESHPSRGWVLGSVVVFVDATTGRAEQAITY